MHNVSAVQKLRHSSNPQPPALRRQASSTTSVLALKERRPDCILQPTPGKRWEPVLSGVPGRCGLCTRRRGLCKRGKAPALENGDITGRRGPCAGRCGLCTRKRGLCIGGVVSAPGGMASAAGGVASAAGGIASATELVVSLREAWRLHWEVWSLHQEACSLYEKHGLCTSPALTVPVCGVGAL